METLITFSLSAIQSKYSDWKDFLVKRLTGARTLPSNFYMKVMESVSSIFRPNMKLELVDKMRICQVRVTTIKEITGRRLYLQYDETEHEDNVFWCHEESPLIHPIGKKRRTSSISRILFSVKLQHIIQSGRFYRIFVYVILCMYRR